MWFLAFRVATDPDFGRYIGGVLIGAENNQDKLKGSYCQDLVGTDFMRRYIVYFDIVNLHAI